jgi:hypothetical protein
VSRLEFIVRSPFDCAISPSGQVVPVSTLDSNILHARYCDICGEYFTYVFPKLQQYYICRECTSEKGQDWVQDFYAAVEELS